MWFAGKAWFYSDVQFGTWLLYIRWEQHTQKSGICFCKIQCISVQHSETRWLVTRESITPNPNIYYSRPGSVTYTTFALALRLVSFVSTSTVFILCITCYWLRRPFQWSLHFSGSVCSVILPYYHIVSFLCKEIDLLLDLACGWLCDVMVTGCVAGCVMLGWPGVWLVVWC